MIIIVCALGFCVMVFLSISKDTPTTQTVIDTIQERRNEVLNVINEKYEKEVQHYDAFAAASSSLMIDTILRNCMKLMGGDRAFLFRFHNGSHDVSGQAMYFFSNTNEVVFPGISMEIRNLQRLPISILAPTWMPKLQEHKYFILEPAHETHVQSRMILQEQGIQKLVIVAITHLGKIIGFIGVDYVRTNPKTVNTECLLEAAHLIHALIVKEDRK